MHHSRCQVLECRPLSMTRQDRAALVECKPSNLDKSPALVSKPHASFSPKQGCPSLVPSLGYNGYFGDIKEVPCIDFLLDTHINAPYARVFMARMGACVPT
ncbi:hypothetical protein Acr_00g0092940 [Actinidia rufa]|uniref:Uncharacterized protein n=1 Tax=Actinidia rufa TaxID=165716 RepID=A0A7J0DZE5_9ERIC|nr:hypothetical protein Acr_00g0092940 [Actinidia rufa]